MRWDVRWIGGVGECWSHGDFVRSGSGEMMSCGQSVAVRDRSRRIEAPVCRWGRG
jgi:hypothetical protein